MTRKEVWIIFHLFSDNQSYCFNSEQEAIGWAAKQPGGQSYLSKPVRYKKD
jgi:hypothetical protein